MKTLVEWNDLMAESRISLEHCDLVRRHIDVMTAGTHYNIEYAVRKYREALNELTEAHYTVEWIGSDSPLWPLFD